MANRNYNTSNLPAAYSLTASSDIRDEFGKISTGFTGIESEIDGKLANTTTAESGLLPAVFISLLLWRQANTNLQKKN